MDKNKNHPFIDVKILVDMWVSLESKLCVLTLNVPKITKYLGVMK